MSTLLVDELYPGVTFSQIMTITRPTSIAVIRPWIYLHNTLQDGDLQLEILQGATVLVTKTLNYVDLNAIKTEAFFHGYVKFEFDNLQLNVSEGSASESYTFRLSMVNHSLDTTNFLGIVREWENTKYPTTDALVNSSVAPAGMEIYAYRST